VKASAVSILSTSDIERINEESLRVLWDTGVQVSDADVAALLEEHGCTVVDDTCVVRFPREVVCNGLRQCSQIWFAGQGHDLLT